MSKWSYLKAAVRDFEYVPDHFFAVLSPFPIVLDRRGLCEQMAVALAGTAGEP